MTKEYHFSDEEIEGMQTLYRLSFSRNKIGKVMKWSHDKTQFAMKHYLTPSDVKQHNEMLREGQAYDRAQAKLSGRPRRNWRLQREIQIAADFLGQKNSRFEDVKRFFYPEV